jgi:predicted butyrate kinase (DUF1464 family)
MISVTFQASQQLQHLIQKGATPQGFGVYEKRFLNVKDYDIWEMTMKTRAKRLQGRFVILTVTDLDFAESK